MILPDFDEHDADQTTAEGLEAAPNSNGATTSMRAAMADEPARRTVAIDTPRGTLPAARRKCIETLSEPWTIVEGAC